MKSLSDSIVMIMKLENRIKVSHNMILRMPLEKTLIGLNKFDESPNIHAFVYDARQFVLYNRLIIEQAPLQAYCSALVFALEKSIVLENFKRYIPSWIQREPRVETHWNTML